MLSQSGRSLTNQISCSNLIKRMLISSADWTTRPLCVWWIFRDTWSLMSLFSAIDRWMTTFLITSWNSSVCSKLNYVNHSNSVTEQLWGQKHWSTLHVLHQTLFNCRLQTAVSWQRRFDLWLMIDIWQWRLLITSRSPVRCQNAENDPTMWRQTSSVVQFTETKLPHLHISTMNQIFSLSNRN